MKIPLLGKNGQVGRALTRCLSDHSLIAPNSTACSLLNPTALRDTVRLARPDLVINAAAYTNVDGAETDQQTCFAVNSEAPETLAEEANRCGALLVRYSSDYVFDGLKDGAYTEHDTPSPLSVYGESKAHP